MSDPSRALQNLNGAARLVAEAAANLRTTADVTTRRRLRKIQAELKLIEEQQRAEISREAVSRTRGDSSTRGQERE